MITRLFGLTVLAVFTLLVAVNGPTAMAGKQKGRPSCSSCHGDIGSILPKEHPKTTGTKIDFCFKCHVPGTPDKAEPRPFSAIMHSRHTGPNADLDCTACHIWKPNAAFGLPGASFSLGKPTSADLALSRKIFLSWAASSNLDSLHAKSEITCLGCHGKNLPRKGDTVGKERCVSCHGGIEVLAAKTAPVEFPDRNPHQSHLGELECAVCHKAHTASEVYCLQCHKQFNMKIKCGEGQ